MHDGNSFPEPRATISSWVNSVCPWSPEYNFPCLVTQFVLPTVDTVNPRAPLQCPCFYSPTPHFCSPALLNKYMTRLWRMGVWKCRPPTQFLHSALSSPPSGLACALQVNPVLLNLLTIHSKPGCLRLFSSVMPFQTSCGPPVLPVGPLVSCCAHSLQIKMLFTSVSFGVSWGFLGSHMAPR